MFVCTSVHEGKIGYFSSIPIKVLAILKRFLNAVLYDFTDFFSIAVLTEARA